MKVIKRIIIGIMSVLCLVFTLTGCAKRINTEYENVEVHIVDEYHRGMYITPIHSGKVTTMVTHPAVYRITVEYDGVEYTISGKDIYNKYKNMVGQTAIGILEIRTFDNGTVKHNITNLE